MKNALYDFANLFSSDNSDNNLYSNNRLTSRAIAAGMPISDAMLMGAEYDLKQNQAQKYAAETEVLKHEAIRQQLIQDQLSQLGIEDPADIQGNFNRFIKGGYKATEAVTMATQLAEPYLKAQMQGEKIQADMQNTLFKSGLEMQQESLKDQKKVLSEAQNTAKGSAEMISDLKELKTLMPDISLMGVGAETKSKFIDPIFNEKSAAAAAKFQSIANALVSTLTTRLKGALSEKELDFLIKMVPSLSTSREGNEQIINYLEKAAKRGIQYSKELKGWLKKGGSVEDFKEYWNDYVAQNSIIDSNHYNDNQNTPNDDIEAKRQRFEQLKAMRPMR